MHFEHRIVPANDWKRCNSQGEGLKGNTDEARPHFVPVTQEGHTFMKYALFQGGTGLCPGLVRCGDDWIYSFRFIQLPDDPEQIRQMLDDIDSEVERITSSVA